MTALVVAGVIAIVVIGLLLVGELLGILLMLLGIRKVVEKINHQVDPVVVRTTALLDSARTVVQHVQARTDTIGARAEDVAQRVEGTAGGLQRLVTSPIITVLAIILAIRRAMTGWRKRRARYAGLTLRPKVKARRAA